MEKFVNWICSFDVVLHFDFWDMFFLFILLMLLWFGTLGYRLYKAFKKENPSANVENWIDSIYGTEFLVVVLSPIMPFILLTSLLVMPFSLAHEFVVKRLNKHK